MISILINIGTVVLILVSLFLALVILSQRSTGDGNMSAMGGGMMESTFGPDTNNVLTGLTIKSTVVFFVLSFLIYLGYVYRRAHPGGAKGALPNISAPASTVPGLPGLPAAGPKKAAPSAATPVAPSPGTAPAGTKTAPAKDAAPKSP